MEINNITFDQLITDKSILDNAVINDRYIGFKEDYLVLHYLLSINKFKTFFEIGTNTGWGTKIIKNALGEDSIVVSLDLPIEMRDVSKQYPLNEGRGNVGWECDLPFTQLFGDSRNFPFYLHACEGYFIDGEHTTENVKIETTSILKLNPEFIIWHDADMPEVYEGIISSFIEENLYKYHINRVIDTRMMYIIRKGR